MPFLLATRCITYTRIYLCISVYVHRSAQNTIQQTQKKKLLALANTGQTWMLGNATINKPYLCMKWKVGPRLHFSLSVSSFRSGNSKPQPARTCRINGEASTLPFTKKKKQSKERVAMPNNQQSTRIESAIKNKQKALKSSCLYCLRNWKLKRSKNYHSTAVLVQNRNYLLTLF